MIIPACLMVEAFFLAVLFLEVLGILMVPFMLMDMGGVGGVMAYSLPYIHNLAFFFPSLSQLCLGQVVWEATDFQSWLL